MVIYPQQVGPVEDKHITFEALSAHVSYRYCVRLGSFFYVEYKFPDTVV